MQDKSKEKMGELSSIIFSTLWFKFNAMELTFR